MSMMKGNFVLFQVDDGWIVYNTSKKFQEGHTHLRSKTSAMAAIDFVQKEKIPRKCGFYYLVSLIRLSNNPEYVAKVNELIEVRRAKGPKAPCYKPHGLR